ncbi:MAG: outer membrane beta-barrel protein [Bacteroidales bacterium]|jgi:hypothetical protein|nr:outer membrane beta-barrel protein [Bacteroidales bacterium]
MKTVIFSFLTVLLLTSSALQAQDDKFRFSVLGGLNLQNINGKDFDGDKLENKLLPGFHAGVNALVNIAPDFYFQPGLIFSTKGAKDDESDTRIKVSYVELPLNLLYRADLGEGKVLLGFGPYAAFGIGGKLKDEDGTSYDIEFKNKITGTNGQSFYLKRLDMGGNIFFGYEMASGLFATLNAQLGMLNIYPEYEAFEDSEISMKNTGFGLSLGYRF